MIKHNLKIGSLIQDNYILNLDGETLARAGVGLVIAINEKKMT